MTQPSKYNNKHESTEPATTSSAYVKYSKVSGCIRGRRAVSGTWEQLYQKIHIWRKILFLFYFIFL